jgi:hypothetical protein
MLYVVTIILHGANHLFPLIMAQGEFPTSNGEISSKCGKTLARVRLREYPSVDGYTIIVFPPGEIVCFSSFDEADGYKWGQVTDLYYGKHGWVALKYISDLRETTLNSSFDLADKSTDPTCLYNKYDLKMVSNKNLIIGSGLQSSSLNQLQRFDTVVAKYMNRSLTPVINWYLDLDNPPEISQSISFDGWAGVNLKFEYRWDGCTVSSDIRKIPISVNVFKGYDSASFRLEVYLHERSHSLGSLHGAEAGNYIAERYLVNFLPEHLAYGPMDAFWWSDVGKDAYSNSCTRFTDETYLSACQEIVQILASP